MWALSSLLNSPVPGFQPPREYSCKLEYVGNVGLGTLSGAIDVVSDSHCLAIFECFSVIDADARVCVVL